MVWESHSQAEEGQSYCAFKIPNLYFTWSDYFKSLNTTEAAQLIPEEAGVRVTGVSEAGLTLPAAAVHVRLPFLPSTIRKVWMMGLSERVWDELCALHLPTCCKDPSSTLEHPDSAATDSWPPPGHCTVQAPRWACRGGSARIPLDSN